MRQKKQVKMYSLVEKWQSSSQSKKTFCESHHLNPTSFHYWIQKYKSLKGQDSTIMQDSSFVALSVSKPSRQPERVKELIDMGVELDYPNGVRLRLSGPISISYLSSLVKIPT